jgi:hypothetical protein
LDKKRDILEEYGAILVKEETGEILSRELLDKLIEQEKKEENKRLLRKFYNEEDLNSQEIIIISNILNRGGIKLEEYDSFNDYCVTDTMAMFRLAKILGGEAFRHAFMLAQFVKGNNTLQTKNNKNLVTDESFAKAFDITVKKWQYIKKELIEHKVIKKLKFDGITMYKLNPLIIGRSMKISPCSYYAFREELKPVMNKFKVLYWDKKLLEEFGEEALNNNRKFKK